MSDLLLYRIIIRKSRKEVTHDLVMKKMVEEIGQNKYIIIIDYKIEDMKLLHFQSENDPEDSYYQEVSSVIVKYCFR